jgi:predicted RNA-binding protein associated with RNAse of E/G family
MATVAFDTLKLATALRAAQFSPEQAEGAAKAIAEAVQSDVATKADLASGLAETKVAIIQWVAGLIGFQTLAVIGAALAVMRFSH